MKTLIIILIAVGFIYFLISSNRKTRAPHEKFWDKRRSQRFITGPDNLPDKKYPEPKDVVERLSKAGPQDDTYKDEDRFQSLVDRCVDNGQRKKLAQVLEKAVENFPPHLQDGFFRDDYLFRELVDMYAEYPGELIELLGRDTQLARSVFDIVGQDRIAESLIDGLYDYFEKDGDENFSKLKKKIGRASELLDVAIAKFLQDHGDYVTEVKEGMAAEKNLSEVRAKGEAKLKAFLKEKVPKLESYNTKQYIVFHLQGRKKDWLVRFHNKREIPVLEFKDGSTERIYFLKQMDQMHEKIIRSAVNQILEAT